MEFLECVIKVEPADNEEDSGTNEGSEHSRPKDIATSVPESVKDGADDINMKSRLLGFGLAPATKRRHNVLTLDTKLELIKRLEGGESVASLASHYKIGRATIFDIKNKKDSIRSFASRLNSDAEVRTRKMVRKVVRATPEEKKARRMAANPTLSNSTVVFGPTAATPKRKHTVLSIEEKIEILQRLERGESGASLAQIYKIGTATVSDIKAKKDSILTFASKLSSDDGLKKRKTMRRANDTSLEDAVYMWYAQKVCQGETVTGPLLCEKALELNSKLGGQPDFKASTGWLKNFKSRHGIRHVQGDSRETPDSSSASGDASDARTFLASYMELLLQEGYAKDDIYSADECEVDWRSMPDRSVLSGEPARADGRVTLLVCANASWTHALPLTMIGRSGRSRCFGRQVSCLPVVYRRQNHGWMNAEIFMEWYAKEFIPTVKKERRSRGRFGRVLLLIDSAPIHPMADMLNVVDDDFKVMFIPSNVTRFAHPMDKDAVRELKWSFKKQLLRRLLLATDDEEMVSRYARSLSLKECCYMLADAWQSLCSRRKKEEWDRSLGASEQEPAKPDLSEEKELKEFSELFKAIPGFSSCTVENAREWLKIDAGDPGDLIMSEDEIVTCVAADASDDEEDDEKPEVEENESLPTHSEAFNAFEVAMEWCEKQEECCPEQLILLKRLRDLAAKKIWIK